MDDILINSVDDFRDLIKKTEIPRRGPLKAEKSELKFPMDEERTT
jgi:hypothetical protein